MEDNICIETMHQSAQEDDRNKTHPHFNQVKLSTDSLGVISLYMQVIDVCN